MEIVACIVSLPAYQSIAKKLSTCHVGVYKTGQALWTLGADAALTQGRSHDIVLEKIEETTVWITGEEGKWEQGKRCLLRFLVAMDWVG